MSRPAQTRSGFLIALTMLALGAITTASAAPPSQQHSSSSAFEIDQLPPSTPEQLGLSKHLKAAGALFYGAWWCPACTRQKALFGKQGSQQLPYIECDKVPADRDVCTAAGIKAFPTWVLKGKERLVGVQSLEELKRWSDYQR